MHHKELMDRASPENKESTITERDICRCGYGKDHPIVAPANEYSILGWILWATGISSRPRKVRLECPVCHHVFETITDPVRCDRFRYR